MRKVILFVLLFLVPAPVFADQMEEDNSEAPLTDTVNQASDASFDKRLPPVLPGEEVRDGNKKMKVWSTSGPVPVGQAPAAPNAPEPFQNNIGVGEVGVIIDRDRRRDN